MSEDEMKNLAQEFAADQVRDFEFLSVVEAEELEDLSEDDLLRIHELVVTAQVTLSWPEAG